MFSMIPENKRPIPITLKRYCPTCGAEIKQFIDYDALSRLINDDRYDFLTSPDRERDLIRVKSNYSIRALILEWKLRCMKCGMEFEVTEYWKGYKNVEKWLEGLNDKGNTNQ